MVLEQYDKLSELCSELISKYRKQNFRIIKLEKDNIELKKKIELYEQNSNAVGIHDLHELKKENERLKTKNQQVKSQLNKIVSRLERNAFRQPGVVSER